MRPLSRGLFWGQAGLLWSAWCLAGCRRPEGAQRHLGWMVGRSLIRRLNGARDLGWFRLDLTKAGEGAGPLRSRFRRSLWSAMPDRARDPRSHLPATPSDGRPVLGVAAVLVRRH